MVGVCIYVYLCVKNIIPGTPPHLFPRVTTKKLLRGSSRNPRSVCALLRADYQQKRKRNSQTGGRERKSVRSSPLPPPLPPHIYDPTTHTLVLVDPLLPTANRSLVLYLVKCASWFSSNLGNVRP